MAREGLYGGLGDPHCPFGWSDAGQLAAVQHFADRGRREAEAIAGLFDCQELRTHVRTPLKGPLYRRQE